MKELLEFRKDLRVGAKWPELFSEALEKLEKRAKNFREKWERQQDIKEAVICDGAPVEIVTTIPNDAKEAVVCGGPNVTDKAVVIHTRKKRGRPRKEAA